MIRRVRISRRAEKQLRKIPRHVVSKLRLWIWAVELEGLEEVRKVSGYHDEPLKGSRSRQRSIRLNRSYRAVYELKTGLAEFVSIEEVSKHEY